MSTRPDRNLEVSARVKLPVLTPQGEYEIRRWEEVCDFALPGESIGEHTALDGHYLVQFWPLVVQYENQPYDGYSSGVSDNKGPCHAFTAPCIFDIDTTAKPDDEASGYMNSMVNHWSRVVHILTSACHPYGQAVKAAWGGEKLKPGAICRGDASFSNDPFAAALMLRYWYVQTPQREVPGYGKGWKEESRLWWGSHGESWFNRHVRPMCIVVPTETMPQSVVVPLSAGLANLRTDKIHRGWVYEPAKVR